MKKALVLPPLMAVALFALAPLACANRDEHALTPGHGGSGGSGTGVGGVGVDGGGVGGAAGGGMGGRGTGGGNGGSGVGGATACSGDAGVDAAACTAAFNFENCALYGSTITSAANAGNPAAVAFTDFSNVSDTSCGSGALKIDTVFFPPADGGANGGQGSLTGELVIPVSGKDGQDFTGKTLTLNIKVSPPATSNMQLFVFVIGAGYEPALMLSASQLSATWKMWSVTLDNSVDAGLSMVTGISIQAKGRGDTYSGAIYVDEIDIKTTPPDGGVTDASSQ